MPRISGRSSLTTVSCMRWIPSRRTVSFWSFGRPIALRTWVTLSWAISRTPSVTPYCSDSASARAALTRSCAAATASSIGLGATSCTSRPRFVATCCGVRRPCRPATAAFRMLIWFAEPIDLDKMSLIPAHSTSARTGPPAITPVPGAAGFSSTRARAGLADDLVRDRRAHHRHLEHLAAGLLDALRDRGGHLLGLAVADADPPGAVADDDERGEREPASALHDLGDPVDRDRPVPRTGSSLRSSRRIVASDLQSSLTGSVGERGDAPVVPAAAAVEHDRLDPGVLRAARDQLADRLRSLGRVRPRDLGVVGGDQRDGRRSSISCA